MAPANSSPGWLAVGIFFLASASIGWAAGYLAGQSGPDANVLAAVLPVVISGAGGALVFVHLKSPAPPTPVSYYITGFAVIVFTTSLLAGAHIGRWLRNYTDELEFQQALRMERAVALSQREARMQYLEQCSRHEFIINRGRETMGLPPLSTEQICGPPPP